MKDRVLKFITKEGISPTRFADEIGVQRSSVSHILSGRNNPSFDFIQKILLRYKNLSSDWLILGTGDMYKKEEKNIIVTPDAKPIFNQPRPQSPPLQKDLFSESNTHSEVPPLPVPEKIPEITESKPVEKIIVIYKDKTFSEYKPSS